MDEWDWGGWGWEPLPYRRLDIAIDGADGRLIQRGSDFHTSGTCPRCHRWYGMFHASADCVGPLQRRFVPGNRNPAPSPTKVPVPPAIPSGKRVRVNLTGVYPKQFIKDHDDGKPRYDPISRTWKVTPSLIVVRELMGEFDHRVNPLLAASPRPEFSAGRDGDDATDNPTNKGYLIQNGKGFTGGKRGRPEALGVRGRWLQDLFDHIIEDRNQDHRFFWLVVGLGTGPDGVFDPARLKRNQESKLRVELIRLVLEEHYRQLGVGFARSRIFHPRFVQTYERNLEIYRIRQEAKGKHKLDIDKWRLRHIIDLNAQAVADYFEIKRVTAYSLLAKALAEVRRINSPIDRGGVSPVRLVLDIDDGTKYVIDEVRRNNSPIGKGMELETVNERLERMERRLEEIERNTAETAERVRERFPNHEEVARAVERFLGDALSEAA